MGRFDAYLEIAKAIQDPSEKLSELFKIGKGLIAAYTQQKEHPKVSLWYTQCLKIATKLEMQEEKEQMSRDVKSFFSSLKDTVEGNLQQFYQALIAPLKPHLSPNSKVTIVPNAVLSELPFAIFKDQNGRYLIEDYTLSVIPSLATLDSLDQFRKQNPCLSEEALVVGDPQDNLDKAFEGACSLGKLLNTTPLLSDEATIANVEQKAVKARWLDFGCHGWADKTMDRNSVFEGALGLAPTTTESQDGWWHAEQIQKLPLQAELAFLGSCKSGKGKKQHEGVIGLTRSFLAAGVSSVVATHWNIPDSKWSNELTETFYYHILGKSPHAEEKGGPLDKGEALREMMLGALEEPELRDRPEVWGAFFLLGLS